VSATARNVAIVLALAAVVMVVPGGGDVSAAIVQLLVIAMLSSIAYLGVRLYREHRTDIYSLGERNRAILYGSIGLATLLLAATDRMWDSGGGTIAWFALMALAVYGVYAVFRASREY
jgi:hypothetical protein